MAHYWALWLLVHVGGRVPLPILEGIASSGGTLAWWCSRRLREVTRDHMRHVLGVGASQRDVDRAARDCVRTTARGYADFAHLSRMSPEIVREAITSFDGLDAILEAQAAGHGVIVISAHLGAPEVLSHAAPALGLHFGGIEEPLRPQRVYDFVRSVRATPGVRYFTANLGGLREARAHLGAGNVLGLLVDRDVLGTGRPYAFFGERALMPTGAVEIARRTGAPIIAVWTLREHEVGRYRLVARRLDLPPATGDRAIDLDSGMRTMLDALEDGIRLAPGQWFPLAPVWSGLAADRISEPHPDNPGPYNGSDGKRTATNGA